MLSATDAQIRDILSRLRCPTCDFQSVVESQAPLACDIKSFVTEAVQQGMSEAQILKYLVQRYGQAISLDPGFSSDTLLLWGVPIFMVIILGILVVLWYKR